MYSCGPLMGEGRPIKYIDTDNSIRPSQLNMSGDQFIVWAPELYGPFLNDWPVL